MYHNLKIIIHEDKVPNRHIQKYQAPGSGS